MKRAIAALAFIGLATAGVVAAAQDQGSTLITVQWDGGASTSDAAAAPTSTATTATAEADAGAPPADVDAGTREGGAAAQGKSRYRGDIDAYYRYVGLDLDVSGGGGYFWGEKDVGRGIGFGRVRGGIMYASWPFIYSAGATFESNNLSPLAWGAEVEATHIGAGLWLQLGGSVDWKAKFAGHAAVGWSVFGVEAGVRGYEDALDVPMPSNYGYGFQLTAKVRVPIGFILYVLSRK